MEVVYTKVYELFIFGIIQRDVVCFVSQHNVNCITGAVQMSHGKLNI